MTAAQISTPATEQREPILQLLVQWPSPPGVFFRNLGDLFIPRRLPRLELRSAPAAFWPDVFVKRGMPWFGFAQSVAWHAAAFLLLLEIVYVVGLRPQPVPKPAFDHSQVIYYSASDYLPPLDTRASELAPADPPKPDPPRANPNKEVPRKPDPEFSRQPIISLPPEADNHRQTIVTPPKVKLKHDVPLPNIVKWSGEAQKPQLAVPAAPLTPAAELSRLASPKLDASVVAPPPSVDVASNRRIGDLNIGHDSVIAPAPQLTVDEQRTVSARASEALKAQVVPPPPSLDARSSAESVGSSGRVIALNLHPEVAAPPDPPAGNRRGAFAATPEGRPGASGNPGSSSAGGSGGHAGGSANGSALPSGLYVGSAPAKTASIGGDPSVAKATVNPNLLASARLPHASAAPATLHSENGPKLAEVERAVFADRQVHALTLNMPNLNSAGGSWVVHFAEINPDKNSKEADIVPPVPTVKVDPGYPVQLMRENVAGTVILHAVILADGKIGSVHVLRSVDPRLDQRASDAIAQWQFQPAMKNGSPVAVEATFQIPFKPAKLNSF